MKINPTLACPCDKRFLGTSIQFDERPRDETAFNLADQTYSRCYDRCAICGHWFSRHDLDLSALYSEEYVTSTYADAEGMASRFRRIMDLPVSKSDNANRVARILKLTGGQAGLRLLDVGAGLGVFPAAMKAAGWIVLAVERDPRTVKHLRDVVGVTAIGEDLSFLAPENTGPFELISFNKVLEHVENPLAMLIHAKSLLAEAGSVYVEVPDGEQAAVGGRFSEREEFFIEHHHVFSMASLSMLAERAGLVATVVERLEEPSGKFTLWAMMSLA